MFLQLKGTFSPDIIATFHIVQGLVVLFSAGRQHIDNFTVGFLKFIIFLLHIYLD